MAATCPEIRLDRCPEIRLEVRPRARFEIVDVRQRVLEMYGPVLEGCRSVLYCSYHTTAGYLDQGLATRLNARRAGVTPYLRAYQTVFPEGAGYQHDELHLREELSEEQRRTEPRNGDSHLAFIGAGLRNCVAYHERPNEPVYFIDFDGVNGACARQRITSIVGFNDERVAALERFRIPVPAQPVDSVNLKDPSLGLFDRIQTLIDRHGVTKGRIQLTLAETDRRAGLTVNEFETLLMKRDLRDVIGNPFRFMVKQPCRMLASLRRIRTRTMTCTRFLRLQRSISLLVSESAITGVSGVVHGKYQSPILVQWGLAGRYTREIDFCLTQFQ
jgi:thiamine phosphate synthase YjbQ (UPF0047 family)